MLGWEVNFRRFRHDSDIQLLALGYCDQVSVPASSSGGPFSWSIGLIVFSKGVFRLFDSNKPGKKESRLETKNTLSDFKPFSLTCVVYGNI